jgi:uncharacterized membrane protein
MGREFRSYGPIALFLALSVICYLLWGMSLPAWVLLVSGPFATLLLTNPDRTDTISDGLIFIAQILVIAGLFRLSRRASERAYRIGSGILAAVAWLACGLLAVIIQSIVRA